MKNLCILPKNYYKYFGNFKFVSSVVEWLMHRNCYQNDLGSKPTLATLLCPWERHLKTLSPA